MSITHTQQLYKSLKNSKSFLVSKTRPANSSGPQTAHIYSGGIPTGVASATTTAVALSNATSGAIPFTNPVAPERAYLGELIVDTVGGTHTGSIELYDHLAHCGGINHTLTTAQAITGFDLQTLGSTSNISQRIGSADYSEVMWWYVTLTTAGTTATNITVNVTYNDGTTGNLTAFAGTVGTNTTFRANKLNGLIPAADQGKFIRGVNSVSLSASTGGVGNAGILATRFIGSASTFQTVKSYTQNWTELGLPRIFNDSCLGTMHFALTGGNTTVSRAKVKVIYG